MKVCEHADRKIGFRPSWNSKSHASVGIPGKNSSYCLTSYGLGKRVELDEQTAMLLKLDDLSTGGR